jgi:hypothetical protein
MPADASTDPRALITDFHSTILRCGNDPAKCSTAQRHAIDRFAKGLLAFSDDALIDTYHQAMEDLRAARAEGSDNLSKAHAQALATKKAMQERFSDYRARYKLRYP